MSITHLTPKEKEALKRFHKGAIPKSRTRGFATSDIIRKLPALLCGGQAQIVTYLSKQGVPLS